MSSKFKIGLQIFIGVFAITISFGTGFYRGYLSSWRASLGFDLRLNEALYGDLEQKNHDAIRRTLQVIIVGDAKATHLIENNPPAYFLYASSHANAGNDLTEPLQKADILINKEHLEQTVPTAIPVH
jgi:hypothetical protein